MTLTYLLPIVCVLILICSYPLIKRRFKTYYKGKIGEHRVKRTLNRLNKNRYTVINNVLLKYNGFYSQIDHIVISPYGIFVIETKNYKGTIFGGCSSQFWTQNLWGHKYKLYNPLWQNDTHIKILKTIYPKLPKRVYVSIAVFPNSTTLNINGNLAEYVIRRRKLKKFIKSYKEEIISVSDCAKLADCINQNNIIKKRSSRSKHKRFTKKAVKYHTKMAKMERCPRCGGELIERNGTYGRFLGCSNYPQCTFTKPLCEKQK